MRRQRQMMESCQVTSAETSGLPLYLTALEQSASTPPTRHATTTTITTTIISHWTETDARDTQKGRTHMLRVGGGQWKRGPAVPLPERRWKPTQFSPAACTWNLGDPCFASHACVSNLRSTTNFPPRPGRRHPGPSLVPLCTEPLLVKTASRPVRVTSRGLHYLGSPHRHCRCWSDWLCRRCCCRSHQCSCRFDRPRYHHPNNRFYRIPKHSRTSPPSLQRRRNGSH